MFFGAIDALRFAYSVCILQLSSYVVSLMAVSLCLDCVQIILDLGALSWKGKRRRKKFTGKKGKVKEEEQKWYSFLDSYATSISRLNSKNIYLAFCTLKPALDVF